MIKEARELVKIHKNIIIKIPMTIEGLKAVKILTEENIKTNVTLIFSATQALLAARAGATYVSPFLGRLDDIGNEGMNLIEEIVEIFSIHDIHTEIIAASIRNPIHVIQAARIGAHIATIPYNVIEQMTKHPLTDLGVERFLKDWEGVPKKQQRIILYLLCHTIFIDFHYESILKEFAKELDLTGKFITNYPYVLKGGRAWQKYSL